MYIGSPVWNLLGCPWMRRAAPAPAYVPPPVEAAAVEPRPLMIATNVGYVPATEQQQRDAWSRALPSRRENRPGYRGGRTALDDWMDRGHTVGEHRFAQTGPARGLFGEPGAWGSEAGDLNDPNFDGSTAG